MAHALSWGSPREGGEGWGETGLQCGITRATSADDTPVTTCVRLRAFFLHRRSAASPPYVLASPHLRRAASSRAHGRPPLLLLSPLALSLARAAIPDRCGAGGSALLARIRAPLLPDRRPAHSVARATATATPLGPVTADSALYRPSSGPRHAGKLHGEPPCRHGHDLCFRGTCPAAAETIAKAAAT